MLLDLILTFTTKKSSVQFIVHFHCLVKSCTIYYKFSLVGGLTGRPERVTYGAGVLDDVVSGTVVTGSVVTGTVVTGWVVTGVVVIGAVVLVSPCALVFRRCLLLRRYSAPSGVRMLYDLGSSALEIIVAGFHLPSGC